MLLPDCLHVNPLMIIQGHGCHKVFRKLFVILQLMLLHIVIYNFRINFIINVRSMQRFGLSLIEIRINRLDAAGNPKHGRQCPRRGDGKKLGIAKSVFFHHFSGLFRSICQEIRRLYDLVHTAFGESAFLLCQLGRSGNGCICHGKTDLIAHLHRVFLSIGQPQLDQRVRQSHNAESDLSPLGNAFSLLRQGMQGHAFLQHFVQRPHRCPHTCF